MVSSRILVLLAGVAVTTSMIGAGALVLETRRAEALAKIEDAHNELELALSSVVLRLSSIAAVIRRSPDLSPEIYATIVAEAGRATERHHERAIALAPRFDPPDVSTLEAYLSATGDLYGATGYPAFRLFPDYRDGPLLPVIFVEPMAAREGVFGFNLGSSPERTEGAERARRTGQSALTAPVVLSQDADTSQVSFLAVYPVTLPAPLAAQGLADGILAASLTPTSLFENFVSAVPRTTVALTLEPAGAVALTAEVSGPRSNPASPLGLTVVEDRSLSTIQLPGIALPVRASAVYVLGLRDLVLPLLAGLVTVAMSFLLLRILRQRQLYADMLSAELERKERELRESERVASRAQRMEALGRLVGGVAHDFNNILAVILGNLEFLRDLIEEKNARDSLDEALLATERGAHLNRQLLSYGRRSYLNPEATDIAAILRETSSLLSRLLPESIQLHTATEAGLWQARIDRSGLETALLNLALNARDAMDSKGKLTIEAGNVRVTEDYLAARPDEEIAPGRYVRVSVTDTGHGMDEATLEKATEPFFTTKEMHEGSGLGLPSVIGFCRQSGGTCRIYSEVGVGTTVHLMLPVPADVADRKPVAPEQPRPAPRAARILVVEDEVPVGDLVKRQLEKAGYEVVLARSGDEATVLLDGGLAIDLLITDIVMPGRVQGPDLARRIERDLPELPILLVSGYPQEAAVNGNGVAQRHQVLIKPVPRSTLLAQVARCLTE